MSPFPLPFLTHLPPEAAKWVRKGALWGGSGSLPVRFTHRTGRWESKSNSRVSVLLGNVSARVRMFVAAASCRSSGGRRPRYDSENTSAVAVTGFQFARPMLPSCVISLETRQETRKEGIEREWFREAASSVMGGTLESQGGGASEDHDARRA